MKQTKNRKTPPFTQTLSPPLSPLPWEIDVPEEDFLQNCQLRYRQTSSPPLQKGSWTSWGFTDDNPKILLFFFSPNPPQNLCFFCKCISSLSLFPLPPQDSSSLSLYPFFFSLPNNLTMGPCASSHVKENHDNPKESQTAEPRKENDEILGDSDAVMTVPPPPPHTAVGRRRGSRGARYRPSPQTEPLFPEGALQQVPVGENISFGGPLLQSIPEEEGGVATRRRGNTMPSGPPRRRQTRQRRVATLPPGELQKYRQFARSRRLSVDLAILGAAPGNPATARMPPPQRVLPVETVRAVASEGILPVVPQGTVTAKAPPTILPSQTVGGAAGHSALPHRRPRRSIVRRGSTVQGEAADIDLRRL